MRKTKRFLATLLAGIMVVAMAGCGSKSGGNKEDVTYSIQGNYIYENEDGGNTDANGVTWYLMVDSETKFHIVGVKPYADAAPSLRIDEGQVVSKRIYTGL